jgi:multiple sugar transport system ATP-binding protein
MAAISIKQLTKRFKSEDVLHEVGLDIEDGEFFVFVGPSGCGKSTLLRLIAGLVAPTSGDIEFDGESVLGLEPRDRNVAMVFQSYALYPHKTVYDNIAFGLKARKTAKNEIDKRVNEIARTLGISELLDRWPRELSGGESQRVAIGRAVVRDPRVYLLDEPLSNLDAQLRIEMRGELAKIHDRVKTTFVYVTHDQVEAMTLGDRIAVIKKGRVQQVDTPAALYDYPATRFVAEFIGSPSMNVIEGEFRAAGEDGNPAIAGEDGTLPLKADELGDPGIEDGERVHAGIRPEAIKIAEDTSDASVSVEITRLEPVGHEGFLYFKLFDEEMVARVDDWQKLEDKEEVEITVPGDRVYLFSPEDGRCLWAKGEKIEARKENYQA